MLWRAKYINQVLRKEACCPCYTVLKLSAKSDIFVTSAEYDKDAKTLAKEYNIDLIKLGKYYNM